VTAGSAHGQAPRAARTAIEHHVRITSIDVENGRISLTQALSKLLVGARASHHHLTGPFL
jgi:hypothetical protein